MNQEVICNIGKYLVSDSDIKYDPCDSSSVFLHFRTYISRKFLVTY
jgi:hypothetical protein